MTIRVDDDWVENKDANASGQCVLNRKFLTNGNSKKGADVLSAAIARPKGGCPFSTPVCRENCYFGTGQHLFHAERYEQNLKFTGLPEFVPTLSTEIVQFAEYNARGQVSVCVHEGGELYSKEYLQKWGEIIGETRHVGNLTYYIYTRSWQVPEYKTALEHIAIDNKNVRINLSTDRDLIAMKGVPSRIGDGLVTYLSVDDTDLPVTGVDLVFRNLRIRHSEPMEYLNGVLVCPYEAKLYIGLNKDGTPSLEKGKCKPIRCQECRICIDRSIAEWDAIKGRYTGTPGEEPSEIWNPVEQKDEVNEAELSKGEYI